MLRLPTVLHLWPKSARPSYLLILIAQQAHPTMSRSMMQSQPRQPPQSSRTLTIRGHTLPPPSPPPPPPPPPTSRAASSLLLAAWLSFSPVLTTTSPALAAVTTTTTATPLPTQPAQQLLRKNIRTSSPVDSSSSDSSTDSSIFLKNVESADTRTALKAALNGDLKLAEAIFAKQTRNDPNDASSWSNLGNIHLQLEQYEEAARNFSAAHELAPSAPVPLLNRCIALQRLNRLDEAVVDCEAAVTLDPEEFAAWHNLGDAFRMQNKHKESAEAYGAAAVLAPGIAGYRLKWALALHEARMADFEAMAVEETGSGAEDESSVPDDEVLVVAEREASDLIPGVKRAVDESADAAQILDALVRKYGNYAEARAARAALTLAAAAPEEYARAQDRAAIDAARALAAMPQLASTTYVSETLGWTARWVSMWQDAMEL